MNMSWRFNKYLAHDLPPEIVSAMQEKGLPPPPQILAVDNSGKATVCEVDEKGEMQAAVALVFPSTEPKRGMAHKTEDMERDRRANLIAAAPDLLEVAKQFMQMNRPRPRISELNKVFELAQKAIAKAEGRAK